MFRTQIAVVGGGASGLSAAAAAAEAGAEVVLLESNAALGGNGLFPRGIFGVDSTIQRRKLTFADADDIFLSCMAFSHWKIDGRIIRALIDKSGDTISWLAEKGVQFTDVVHHIPNQQPEVFHITASEENVGKAVIRVLKDYCEQSGVRILTGTRGKKLMREENGTVNGVVCENKDGAQFHITADRVIICTGGFAGSPALISKFYPTFDASLINTGGGMRHQGDGVTMALEAGADIEGNFAMEIAAPKIKGHEPLNLLLGKPHNVWLNRFGVRFASEGIVYNFAMAANACLRQPGAAVWVLFDKKMMEQTLTDGRDTIEQIHIAAHAEERLLETISHAKADGTLMAAEKLADIADFIGCARDVVEQTVKEYNNFCEMNRDAVFAKERRYLNKLDHPPYYVIKAGADMLITHGGIRVNACFEALNDKYEAVPNLYVAGVDFGGADADVYNVTMSGHGFGFAVNSGRLAGENAAKSVLDR